MKPCIGVFGGSFDPPHSGHVLLAAYALTVAELDQLIVVPTFKHALDKELSAAFEHRVEMTRRAMKIFRDVSVSTVEAELPTPSRTLLTLQAMRDERPEARFRLVVGADILAEVHRWHRWDEVERLAPPLVVGRTGDAPPSEHADGPRPVDSHPVELPAISSTAVRERLAADEPVSSWLPIPVAEYIKRHGLYR